MGKRAFWIVPFIGLALFLSGFSSVCFSAVADYAGVYTGAYDGVDRGLWVVNVKASGTCYLGAWSEPHQRANYVTAVINDVGEVFYTWANQDYVYFKVYADGSAFGKNGNLTTGVVYASGTGQKNDPVKIASYVGAYDGTYKGDDKGTIYFSVAADGSIAGSVSSTVNGVSLLGVGTVTAAGEVFGVSENNTMVFGQISDKGSVSGEWHNYYYTTNGTVSASRDGSSSSDDGGGGGGCFINTMR